MKADLHFHTTLSDGGDDPDKVFDNLVAAKVIAATLTDHDLTSADFAARLQALGIWSTPASEVSTYFHTREGAKIETHMTAYATVFSPEVEAMLATTRTGKAEKVRQQVAKLISQGYPLSHEGLEQWARENGYNPKSLNNNQLSHYVYSIPTAAEIGNSDQQRKTSKPDRVGFLMNCLKREGRNPIGSVEIPEYEPTTQHAVELVTKTGGITSIAHPNFTWARYGKIEGLHRDIRHLVEEHGVQGIELNALATPEWAKVILEIRDRYNLLLTFGSDNHGEQEAGEKHGLLGQMNPYFLEDEKRAERHLKAFKDRLGV